VQLTPEEIAFYERNGYVGPFDLNDPEIVATARRLVDAELVDRESPVYGVKTGRDWHLASREIFDLCSHPAIVERLAGVLGPDVVLWRTQMFYKKPGDEVTAMHQDYSFPGPLNVASIDPPVTVTAWIALDEATIENGCVELVAGTHREGKLETVADDSGPGIFGRSYRLERGVSEVDTVAKMTVKPGQFFLFSNLLVHGSGPNNSEKTRLGIGARFAPTSVRVYPGLSVDGQGMPLDRYGCVLVSGKDDFGHNSLVAPPEKGAKIAKAVTSSAYDTGFKIGYGVGFTKGERHAKRGIRVNLAEKEFLSPSNRAQLVVYGDPDEVAKGIEAGITRGYDDGIEGRAFNKSFGSNVELRNGGIGRVGPIRKGLKIVRKIIRKVAG
jgi:non-heme Fe2+,alpha-ketoglutarate-dependent halogenase